MADGAIDLDEIATPEILYPRQVKGLHSGLRSWNVLGALAGFVNGDRPILTTALQDPSPSINVTRCALASS
jgi:hypothetical protein